MEYRLTEVVRRFGSAGRISTLELAQMSKPTHEDAMIMLQLAQWGASIDLLHALNWMWSDEFITNSAEFRSRYPAGSEGAAKIHTIGNYFETIGTLWKQGLFNEDLVFDWLAVDLVWNRVKDFFIEGRKQAGEPRLWENFEALANAESAR
jgi:hypothetical protein